MAMRKSAGRILRRLADRVDPPALITQEQVSEIMRRAKKRAREISEQLRAE